MRRGRLRRAGAGRLVEGEIWVGLLWQLPSLRNSWRFRRRSVTDAKHADAALLRTCERGCSSFVRPKRSERRSAVDRAFGRAKQARSTWPWSERWPVGASAAQKGASGARVCRTRAGQHRIPLSRPKGGIAVISMFEPALASLSLKSLHWLALYTSSPPPMMRAQLCVVVSFVNSFSTNQLMYNLCCEATNTALLA